MCKNGHMSFFCHNIFNFDQFSPSSSKHVSTAAALSPETVVSSLPKPTWGKGKGWQGAGSNMSAPGCRVNLVHQHLGLYSLIASRWRLSTALVFEAFKVAFSEFAWGQECRVQWKIIWCCGAANNCLKFRGHLSKMIFIYSPVSCPIWCGEEGTLVYAGLPCACRMGTSILCFLSTSGHELRSLFSEDGLSSDKQGWDSGISQSSLPLHSGMQTEGKPAVYMAREFQTSCLSSDLKGQPEHLQEKVHIYVSLRAKRDVHHSAFWMKVLSSLQSHDDTSWPHMAQGTSHRAQTQVALGWPRLKPAAVQAAATPANWPLLLAAQAFCSDVHQTDKWSQPSCSSLILV